MKKKKFGNTNLEITPMCFGTWEIGGFPFFSNQEIEKSYELVENVIQLGINFIDTAPVYGFGRSEEILGKVIKKYRENLVISTKCGLRWNKEEMGAIYTNGRRDSILSEVDQSLTRLQTEYIDLYILHWPDTETNAPIGESIEALEELKHIGKIKYYGVSNFSLEELKEAERYGTIDCLQNRYSLMYNEMEKTHFSYIEETGIGLQIYSPLERGLLTDKTIEELTSQQDPAVEWILNEIDQDRREKNSQLKDLSNKYNISFASFILACTMSRPEITAAIIGSKNQKHLEQLVAEFNTDIQKDDLLAVNKIINS